MVPPEPPGPTPIPVEGDVQIFADPECTQYWTGDAKVTLYARINVPWGFDEGWYVLDTISCLAPSTEYPEDTYGIMYYADWVTIEEKLEPFAAGSVVSLNNIDPYEVENPVCIITKP